MTVRKALIFYLSVLAIAIVGAWLLAVYYDWRGGMALLTVVLIEHAWRVVNMILRNGR